MNHTVLEVTHFSVFAWFLSSSFYFSSDCSVSRFSVVPLSKALLSEGPQTEGVAGAKKPLYIMKPL